MAESTKTLRVKQVKSKIGHPKDQGDTMRSLGLRRINDVAELPDNPSVRGMVFKVRHLVTVEEI